jgi:uncharacterized membrane protein
VKYQATKQRSIAKSVTFRILVIISDLVVIYAITKQIGATIALTVFTNLASTILYFAHERIWNSIAWGRQRDGQKRWSA